MLPTYQDGRYFEGEHVAGASSFVLTTQADECYTHTVMVHLPKQHKCAHRVVHACRSCDLNSWDRRWSAVSGCGTGAGWPRQPGRPDGAECYTRVGVRKKYVSGKNRGPVEYSRRLLPSVGVSRGRLDLPPPPSCLGMVRSAYPFAAGSSRSSSIQPIVGRLSSRVGHQASRPQPRTSPPPLGQFP